MSREALHIDRPREPIAANIADFKRHLADLEKVSAGRGTSLHQLASSYGISPPRLNSPEVIWSRKKFFSYLAELEIADLDALRDEVETGIHPIHYQDFREALKRSATSCYAGALSEAMHISSAIYNGMLTGQ